MRDIFFPMRSVEAKNVRTFAFGSYKRTEAIEEKEQTIFSLGVFGVAQVFIAVMVWPHVIKIKTKKNRVRLVHRDKE